MLNEVTRLTKGDFSKFKEKKYQVVRADVGPFGIGVAITIVATFDTREKATSFLIGLDKQYSKQESYLKIKEVDR